MSSLPEIYADFQNADALGRVRLNCVGTVNDLSRQQVQLRDGLDVVLFSDDADEHGNAGRLIVEGTVTYSQDEQCWVATIDWQKIRRQRKGSPIDSPSGTPAAVLPRTDATVPPVRPTER